METAPVGPTTSSWPSNSVAVVGEAVLNISPSINTKPSAPIVYGTPLAKPVMDEMSNWLSTKLKYLAGLSV